MSVPDPDKLLSAIRYDIASWEKADPNSREEWEAAERATSAMAALDKHITEGGRPPRVWQKQAPKLQAPAERPTPRLPGTAWRLLRQSVQADLEQLKAGDLTIDTNYAMADAFRGVLAKMDAFEPGGAWDQPGDGNLMGDQRD